MEYKIIILIIHLTILI